MVVADVTAFDVAVATSAVVTVIDFDVAVDLTVVLDATELNPHGASIAACLFVGRAAKSPFRFTSLC